MDSLRLPLFFQSFDPEDEKATVKVLEALSRFENIQDLQESTLKVVLANQALRGRLRGADATNDEIFKLVREELLAEHQSTMNVLQETKGTLAVTESQLNESTQRSAQIAADLAEAQRKITAAEERAATLESTNLLQAQQLSVKETLIRKQWFFFLFVIIPVALGGASGWATHALIQPILSDPSKSWGVWAVTGAGAILPLAIACSLAPLYISKHPALSSWWVAKLLSLGKRALVAPFAMTVSAIYQGGVWDGVKNLTGL